MINSKLLFKLFKDSQIPIIIFLPDFPQLTILDSNNSFNEIFGCLENQIIGKSFSEQFNKDKVNNNLVNSLKAVTEKKVISEIYDQEFKSDLSKNNSQLYNIKCEPYFSEDGEVEYINCYFFNTNNSNTHDLTGEINITDKYNFDKDKSPEQWYKILFKSSHLPKWVYDLETLLILDVNENAIEKYGYSREEFLNLSMKDLKPNSEVPEFMKLAKSLKNVTGTIDTGIFTHQKKDGSLIKVNLLGNKFIYKGRSCIMVECIDVTEREEALQLLKNNESKYISAQEIAKLGYWELDLKTWQLYWADEVYNIFGVDKITFKCNMESFFSSIHPEDIQDLIKAFASVLEGLGDLNTEHRIMLPDGTEKWVREIAKIIKDKNGEPILLKGTVQDINTEKQLEISLTETQDLYEYASKATSDFIWNWDLKTDNLYWGDGFKKLFGEDFKNNNDILASWKSRIHPDDSSRVLKSIQEYINGTYLNWSGEYRILKADGTYINVLDKGFFLRDPNGKAYRMVGAMQDISESKTLEALLEKSNRLAKIGSWEIDVLKGTVYWSDITKEIREADPDFAPDLSLGIEFFKEGEHRKTISSRVKECIDNFQSWDEELQIITQKGNTKWIRTIGEPEIVNGKCVKIYGSFQDIDERKKAEQELHSLYNERNTILESIGDAFFAINKNQIITYWNQKAEEVLGLDKYEALGKTLSELNQDLAEAIYSNFNRNKNPDIKVIQLELYLSTSQTWLEINAYPSNNGLSVYLKDVTGKMLAVEKLKMSNERFERVSEASNDGIWEIDLTNNILFLGKGFENLWGENYQKEVHGIENWLIHIFHDDRDRVEKLIRESLKNKEIKSFKDEFYYIKSDKTIIPVLAKASIIRDENGIATRIVGVFTDITIQKEYEKSLKSLNENLAQSNRQLTISNNELEQFAYVTSHDLQEPLRMVTAFLSQIEKKYSDIIDEKGKTYIHFAMDGAMRMRNIILDLLEFSKVGRLEENIKNIDLNKLLNEIIPLYKKKIEETNATIIFENLPTIRSYKTPLRQILQNLISNSLKYNNKENPVIIINVQEIDEYWQFSVKDNGIGIKEEYFSRIFLPFQRLHNRNEYSGTGIGLTIVKKIVETLGGEIRVESGENVGSNFIFTIKK